MLYTTLVQPQVFLSLFLCGLGSSVVFDFKKFFPKFCKKHKIIGHFFDFFAIFLFLSMFFVCNLKFNYGEVRFFSAFAFALALVVEQLISTFLVAKLIKKCYNFFKGRQNGRKAHKKT